MTGYLIMIALAGAVLLGMWPWLRRDLGAIQFVGAAILVALAGYALSGEPGMAGAPKAQQDATERPPSDFSRARLTVFSRFDRAGRVLDLAEAQTRMGYTDEAVVMLRGEIDKSPRNVVLWLGMADALVQHGGGMVTPSAALAFDRAAQVAPNHPGPPFFQGLAVARMGQFDMADRYFERVLALPETTDAWRDLVAQARAAIAGSRGAGPPGPGSTQ